MKRFLFILALIIASFSAWSHPWKPQHYVIVDTDCGLDDFRALCMLLSSPDVRVLAIITSDGVVDAKTGYKKVHSLLSALHHEGILTGIHLTSGIKTADCLPALEFVWGPAEINTDSYPDAEEVVNEVLNTMQEQITFISLGSLASARYCLEKCPDLATRIVEIIWSSKPEYTSENFNYDLDKKAFTGIVQEKVPLHLISGGLKDSYNDALINEIGGIHTASSERLMTSFHADSPFARALFDESVILYLHFPGLFQSDNTSKVSAYMLSEITENELFNCYVKILTGETVNQNQVLDVFPLDSSDYFSDVQPIMRSTIMHYGHEEWVATVMANELHRHLGIYAVIGVKMGIRAKEYFGAGIDEIKIVSYAGLNPPFSCMNDGLQVSTGATLGHGLIQVASDTMRLPKADFTYMNRCITLQLKEEVRNKIESEIRELSKIYGLDSNIYWELVRRSAIRYWASLNRNEIFDIQVL
jgi:pyrimidine-specific ribonucleoside hydrolase